MAISRRIQDLLAKQDFDAIEGDWLAQIDQDPFDLDFFAGVARALAGQAQEARARTLLEMLDDHFKAQGAWRQRLHLLQRVGHLLVAQPEALHAEILASLSSLYGNQPSFKGLVENVGLNKAPHDIPKTWEKVERLQNLVAFDLGEIVLMEGKGAGRVVEVNLALQSFRVEIVGFPKMAVGFKAAPKLLRRIPKEHVLHRKIEDPKSLVTLAEQNPPELLHLVLESYEQPLTAGDIKRDLTGIVPESRWNTFWTAARKHPQVVVSGSGRQTYGWAKSSAHALTSVWSSFANADPRKKIDMLRREGARDLELRGRMEEELVRLAENVAANEGGLACEIWFALEKGGTVPQDAAWSPRRLLGTGTDPRAVISKIEDRTLRERAYTLLRELRDDWAVHFLAALAREDDPRTLELLAASLGEADRMRLDRFLDNALAQPHKAPAAFTWLAERAAQDVALRERNPIRLFQAILNAMGSPEFGPYRMRLLAQVESGGTVPRLLPLLTVDQAAQAEEAVNRSGGLEAYQRDDLQRALHLKFPSLQTEAETTLYCLPESLTAKEVELHKISTKDIPANRKAIEEARALGDLRENFEYKAARQRHEYLTARASELARQLQRARALDLATIDLSEVRIGTTIELAGDAGEKRTLSILGPWESDPDAGVISYESELGQSLLSSKPGDHVLVTGTPYVVEGIRAYAG